MDFPVSSHQCPGTHSGRRREQKLEHRIQFFQDEYPKHESIRTILVTTKGLTQGEHSGDFDKVLILKDLFVENTEEF